MPAVLSERVPWLFQQSFQVGWLKELAEEVEAQAERLDILEGKHKEQAPVDRRLVEEALAMCQDFDAWHGVRALVAEVRDLLHCALG